MADQEQKPNRSVNEPSNHNQNTSGALRRKMQGVNFEEMNFEQRRAPYNSGKRNLAEREYDKDRQQEQSGQKRDGH